MLPELSRHADLILLADIEPKLHQHTQHLLDCLQKTNSIEEFIENYSINNPIENLKTKARFANGYNDSLTISVLIKMLEGEFGYLGDSLKQYHFLSSAERFSACKKALSQLMFTHINFNLLSGKKCSQLALTLKQSNAILTLCNFTNIHDYDKKNSLKNTVPLLLENSPKNQIIYSTDDATFAHISNLSDYLNNVKIESTEEELDLGFLSEGNFEPGKKIV